MVFKSIADGLPAGDLGPDASVQKLVILDCDGLQPCSRALKPKIL